MATSIDKKHRYNKTQLISMFSSSLAPSHPVDWPYAEFLAEKSGSGQPVKAREPQQSQQPNPHEKYPLAGNNPGSSQKSVSSFDCRQNTNTNVGHKNPGTNVSVNSGMNRNQQTHNSNANAGGGNIGGGHMTAEQQRKMFENERRQIEQERENKSKGGDSSSANLMSPDKPSTSLFHDETDNLMKELAVNNNKPLSPAGTKKINVNSLFGSPGGMKVQANVVAVTPADDGSGIMGGLGSLPTLPGIWSQSSGLANNMPTVGSPSSKRSHNKFDALANDDNDFDDVDFSGLIEKMIFDEDLDGGGENANNMGLGSSRFGGLGFNVKEAVDPLSINASSDLSPSTSSKQLHVTGLLNVTSTTSGIEEVSGVQSSAADGGGKNSASFDVLSKLGFQSPTTPPPPTNPQQQQIPHPHQLHPHHPHHHLQQQPQQPPMYNNMPPPFPHSPMMMDPRLMPPYGVGSPPPHMNHMQQQHFQGPPPGGPPNYGGMPHHPPPWMGMRPPVVPHHPHSPAAFAHHPRAMSPPPYHPNHYPPRPLHPGQHPQQQFGPPGGMMMSPPLPEGMPPPQPQHHQQQQPSPRPPQPPSSNQFTFHIHNANGRGGVSKGGGSSTGQPLSSDALVTPNGGGTPSQSSISSSGAKVTQSSPIMSASARQLMKMLKVPAATKAIPRDVAASPELATVNSITNSNVVISGDTKKDKPEAEVSVNSVPSETPQALQRINVSDLFKKKITADIASPLDK